MIWREATRADVPAVVALLADDMLGHGRESAGVAPYLAAFDAMQEEGGNRLIVAEQDGRVVACYQLTLISGLSLTATRRAQVEGVRVAVQLHGDPMTDFLTTTARTAPPEELTALVAEVAQQPPRLAGLDVCRIVHDRLRYRLDAAGGWLLERLAP